MKKLKLWLPMVAVFSLLFASIAFAVPQNKFNFTIVDEDNLPITGNKVYINVTDVDTTTAATLYSDWNGQSSTSATIVVSTGNVDFYGSNLLYDITITDSPDAGVSIKREDIGPTVHKIMFPRLLAQQATTGTFGVTTINATTITDTTLTVTGTATLATVDINAGAIDGTTIGATTKSTGAFTGLSVTGAGATTVTFSDTDITNIGNLYIDGIYADNGTSFSFLNNWTAAGRTCADVGIITTGDWNGGTIDGTTIGASVPSTGVFTGFSASGIGATTVTFSDTNITNVGGIYLDTIYADDGTSFALGNNWTAAGRTCADAGILTTADINGGSVDGTPIGASTPSTGAFNGLSVNATGAQTVTFNDTDITNLGNIYLDGIGADNATSFSMLNNWTNAGRTVADAGILTTVDINGGTADAVVIGGASQAAGTFTTLTTTGKLTVLEMALTQVNKDTDYTILTTDSGKIFTNIGAGAGITLTLPTPFAGARVEVAKVDAQNILVSSGNTILGTTNNAYRTGTAGSSLTLAGVSATQWAVMATVGTWVDTTTAP